VFRAKRTDRIKLIFWDGSGVCLVARRLEDGEFQWPRMQGGAINIRNFAPISADSTVQIEPSLKSLEVSS